MVIMTTRSVLKTGLFCWLDIEVMSLKYLLSLPTSTLDSSAIELTTTILFLSSRIRGVLLIGIVCRVILVSNTSAPLDAYNTEFYNKLCIRSVLGGDYDLCLRISKSLIFNINI